MNSRLCGMVAASLALLVSCTPVPRDSRRALTVLTYDSLMAEDGLGPELVARFEKNCNCRVNVQVAGDAAQIVSRLQLEALRGKQITQVVLGVDVALWPQIRPLADPWTPEASYLHAVEPGFTPFDQSIMGWIWNPKWKGFEGQAVQPPRSWKELLDPKWKRRLLIQDPRTSTPGLGFVLGARSVMQKEAPTFLQAFSSQWMTLAAGWSSSYALFLQGEAPLVWSYITSQAFHRRNDPGSAYQALVFEEGNPIQIEGAAIVAKAIQDPADRVLARAFVSFLVSREVQELIPARQWMLPAISGIPLPPEFRELPTPLRVLPVSPSELPLKQVLRQWEGWIR